MTSKKAVIALSALLLASTAAHAQDMPIAFEGLMGELMRGRLMDDLRERNPGQKGAPGASGATAPRPAPRAPSATAANNTRYRASPEVSARVRAQFIAAMRAQAGPEGARQMAAALEQGDPIGDWRKIVASDGLRPGDTADAFASYWILNWMMANGGDNNRTQSLAVRDQVRPIIASSPAYARLNDAQRQEMAEVLMLNFLLQHAAYLSAMQRGDQAAARQLGDVAVLRFRQEMGVELRQLQLTDRGFVPR